MKAAIMASALLASLISRQEPATETAADLDKHAKESLQKNVVVIKDLTLPLLFFMLDTSGDAGIECYVDPVAVPKVNDIVTSFTGEVSLEEALDRTLQPKRLLHHVWQGIVFVTDDKGRKALQDTDWTGLTQNALRDQAGLSKKLETVYTFKWDAFKPQEALKEFAAKSGVVIKADALKDMEVKIERRGMLCPSRTTLLGALVCLARTTGITYEISKDGGLVAKRPAKK